MQADHVKHSEEQNVSNIKALLPGEEDRSLRIWTLNI